VPAATTSRSTSTRQPDRCPEPPLHRGCRGPSWPRGARGLARVAAVELGVDFCIVNGENVADGVGITPKLADRLLAAGADAITLGNHTWRRPEIASYLRTSERGLRPANLSDSAPGRGLGVLTAADGTTVAIVNVMGSLFLEPKRSMWEIVDELVDEARESAQVVLVDVHAEATSEKVALARWLDGRVTAVIGTHTHVQTSMRACSREARPRSPTPA
jgi:metallophosphoesterase (TIGR00282 family)